MGCFYSCTQGYTKVEATKILKEKIGLQLPFKNIKIAYIEGGTAVIIDKYWCYWIDEKGKVFCVNGTSKSLYNQDNPKCKDAPIKATFSDINKIAK